MQQTKCREGWDKENAAADTGCTWKAPVAGSCSGPEETLTNGSLVP